MKIRRILFFGCFFVLLISNQCAFAQKAWEQSLESAIAKQGLTTAEFQDITSNYYKNPQPEKMISVLKVVLSLDDLILDTQHFGPIAHLMATVAHNDKIFLEKLNLLKDGYQGLQKQTIEAILEETTNFVSPSPDSPKDLDYLWAEFMATGNNEPVKKIVSVLGYPSKGMNIVLIGAAEWSLSSNARQHEIVYNTIKQESLSATGQTKEKLEEILKDIFLPVE